MKKLLLTLLVIISFSCKNEKKTEISSEEITNKNTKPNEVLEPVLLSDDVTTYRKIGVDISEVNEMFLDQNAHLLSRNKDDFKSSYVSTKKVGVKYAEVYKASIIAKKGSVGNLFGMRIAGNYPDRVDAVFNLENGTVKGVEKSRDFENENANIEDLGNGWFKCSVSAEVSADEVMLFMGPTIGNRKANAWTFKTDDACSVKVITSSLTLERIKNKK